MTEHEDKLAIRTLVEIYADAVFRRNAEAWAATWAEDATWDLMGTEVAGRDAILATWLGALEQFSFVGFFCQLGPIALDGDRADARVWVHEILVETSGKQRDVVGAYDDSFVKRGGVWQFSRRAYRIVHEH